MKFHNLQYEPKNRVSKIFVIFLCLNRGREGGGGGGEKKFQLKLLNFADHTVKYGPLN